MYMLVEKALRKGLGMRPEFKRTVPIKLARVSVITK